MGELTAGRSEDEAATAVTDGEVDQLGVTTETIAHLDARGPLPPTQRVGRSTGGPTPRGADRHGKG